MSVFTVILMCRSFHVQGSKWGKKYCIIKILASKLNHQSATGNISAIRTWVEPLWLNEKIIVVALTDFAFMPICIWFYRNRNSRLDTYSYLQKESNMLLCSYKYCKHIVAVNISCQVFLRGQYQGLDYGTHFLIIFLLLFVF